MVRVNMGAPVGGSEPEGTYLGNVTSCEEFKARSGFPGLKVKIQCVYNGATFNVQDTIMLDGGGWGIGRAKLTALGVPEDFAGELDPLDMIGRQVFVHLSKDEYTGSDGSKRSSLKPDKSKGSHSGYSPETDENARAEAGVGSEDGVPF